MPVENLGNASEPPVPSFRIGHGYDIHRLELYQRVVGVPAASDGGILAAAASELEQPVRNLILGGIPFDSDRGPIGHSDGDAVLHAITDALLGALGEPDLGTLFPDSAPENDGRDSADFINKAMHRLTQRGYAVSNLDVTVICERPKIGPHRDAMRNKIASLIGAHVDQVNIKGKTHEGVDAIGEGRAIEVHAVAMLIRA